MKEISSSIMDRVEQALDRLDPNDRFAVDGMKNHYTPDIIDEESFDYMLATALTLQAVLREITDFRLDYAESLHVVLEVHRIQFHEEMKEYSKFLKI